MAADGLREALSKFVPEAVLNQAVEELKNTEIAPEWYRSDIAKVGAEAKEAAELRTRLASIESAPKRKEALKRVGIDYDATPKYGQEALDQIPVDDLDSLEKVAEFVQSKGFEAHIEAEQNAQGQSGAERITQATVDLGAGGSVQTSKAAKDAAFYADMDAVPDGDKNAMAKVLAKHGRLAATEG